MATTNSKKKAASLPNYLGDYTSGNYTPGYDYVSNYYNPNAGYQNPSVYGYRGGRYNIPTNAGFAVPMRDNDPYWNVGAMLGGLWGARYNQRGAEKAGKEASDMLQEHYNKAMGIEQQPQAQQPSASDQMYEVAQRAGVVGETQNQLQDGSAPKAENLGKGLKYFNQQGSLQMPERDFRGESRNYVMNKYGLDTGKVQDNPEKDKKEGVMVGTTVGNDLSKIDVTKLPQGFNSDLLRANIISKLKASGRNEWQIAQAMQGIEPQLLEKQREYNGTQFNDLYQKYDALVKGGRIEDAGMVLDRMKQFNPEGAQALQKQYDRLATNKSKRDAIKDNIELHREYFPNMSDKEIGQMLLGGKGKLGSGGRSSGSGDGTVTSQTGGLTKSEREDFNNLIKLEADGKLTSQSDKAYLNYLRIKRDYGYGKKIDFSMVNKDKDKNKDKEITETKPKSNPTKEVTWTPFVDKEDNYRDPESDDYNEDKNYGDYGDLMQDIAHGVPRAVAYARAERRVKGKQ